MLTTREMATESDQSSLGASLSIFGKLGSENAEKFTHRVIGDICDKEGLHYEEFAKSLSLSEYSKLKLCLSDLFRTLTREKIEKDKIIEKLKGLDVSAETSQIIATCLWVRRDEIRAQLVRDSCNIAHSNLSDFDWSLKLVMSSDQLGSIQQPVVTVDFDLSQDGQRKMESIELSKEELAKFVTSLEAASKVVTQLRT